MLKINKATLIFGAATLFLIAASPSRAQTQLLLPINTNFSYWDHHWIMWIPQHPVYEAVEVLSLDNPRDPANRLIRIFFTERAGGKQVQYFSDPVVAKNWRTEAYFRDIEYRTTGEFGKPLGLYVKFKDKDDRLVELTIQTAKGQTLNPAGAGLKAQGTHGADSAFLLFYNGPSITKTTGKFLIEGKDYSATQAQGRGVKRIYQAAYSLGAYSAVIIYGRSRYDNTRDGVKNSMGRVFKATPGENSGTIYRSNQFGFRAGNYIEITTNPKTGTLSYEHFSGEHVYRIEFEPALPNIDSARSGQMIRYKMSLDNIKNLVEGVLSVKREEKMILLDWQHQAPNWAKPSALRSVIQLDSTGGYDLEVGRKR